MHRIVSLLLIPLCLMGQFFCPHSHVGTVVDEPIEHSSRPHVHLSASYDHQRHHQVADHCHDGEDPVAPETASPLTDHDRDALYLADSTCDSRILVVRQMVDFPPASGVWSAVPTPTPQCASIEGIFNPLDPYGGLPIYLRIASLRI
jgi:hypothetical protein